MKLFQIIFLIFRIILMKVCRLALLLFFVVYVTTFAEIRLTDWKMFTSFANIKTLAIDSSSRYWAGTEGGVFVYNPSNQSTYEFRTDNGLLTNSISFIQYIHSVNKVLVAGLDGTLEIASPGSANNESHDITWHHETAIKARSFPNSEIYDIFEYGPLAYISGGWGISVFNMNDLTFTTSVERIGDLTKNTAVTKSLIKDGYIYAIVSNRLFYANLNDNIQNPNVWTAINVLDTNKPAKVYDMQLFGNQLFVSADSILYVGNYNGFKLEYSHTGAIEKLYSANKLLMQSGSSIISHPEHNTLFNSEVGINFITSVKNSNEILICEKEEGIAKTSNFTDFETVNLNTPASNRFMKLSFSGDGALWAVSGDISTPGDSKGIMRLKNGKWAVYSNKNTPEIKSNSFIKLNSVSENKMVFSNFGNGYTTAELANGTPTFKTFDNTNTPMTGSNGGTYIVCGDAIPTSNGAFSITTYGDISSGNLILNAASDGTFTSAANCYSPNDRTYLNMTQDVYGTLWLGPYPASSGKGILYFNDGANTACGLASTSSHTGLSENTTTVIKSDPNGSVLIGSNSGLSIIVNPSAVLSKSSLIIRNIKALNGTRVNDILIDGGGQQMDCYPNRCLGFRSPRLRCFVSSNDN